MLVCLCVSARVCDVICLAAWRAMLASGIWRWPGGDVWAHCAPSSSGITSSTPRTHAIRCACRLVQFAIVTLARARVCV
jgi:hypothetical protein